MIGIEVFDGSGNVVFDMSSRLGLVMGIINSGTSAGSFQDSRLAEGTPWCFSIPKYTSNNLQQNLIPANASISGTTISWYFPYNEFYAGNVESTIYYGIF